MTDLPTSSVATVRSHLQDNSVQVEIYREDFLLFDSLLLPGMELICDERGEGIILGRNVLNRLIMQMDGPGETVRVGV